MNTHHAATEEELEEDLPPELKSRPYYYGTEHVFTVRPEALAPESAHICDPIIQRISKGTGYEYIRMYSCPFPSCPVQKRTEHWSELRRHAQERHSMEIFKHTVKNAIPDRAVKPRNEQLRLKRRKVQLDSLLAELQQREATSLLQEAQVYPPQEVLSLPVISNTRVPPTLTVELECECQCRN